MVRCFMSLAILVGLSTVPAFADNLSGQFLAQTVQTSKPHRDALSALVRGKQGVPPWVLNMVNKSDYVGLASVQMPVDGKPMQLFYACEAKRCNQSAIRVLFSAGGKHVVMRINDDRLGEKFLGTPSEAERAALDRNPGT
ncbi:Ivy family c-type lysozyme inhibitor [Rhizobium sp.]|jgi:hypothetical protein|uniref:Ivy family c-type lysozyme inhibitor n=1 Tax=Rhizobium sp. TaxID=391 RepID=UPI000E867719|nr:hypothetical protein [Rhizobium sp.]